MNAESPAPTNTALAYDRIAGDYDAQVQAGQWMRAVLWDTYRQVFHPGQHLLDLSCGTGIDALFLAQCGMQVTGIDLSPGMIQQLNAKARRLGLSEKVQANVHDVASLRTWQPDARFDGILSAFAGLNTVPDLGALAGDAARLLPPGGYFIVHMLNRRSLWLWLDQVRHGQWRAARASSAQTSRTAMIGGIPVLHYTYFPLDAYQRFFRPAGLKLHHAYGLGFLWPPVAPRWLPAAWLDRLGTLERAVAGTAPFMNWGQFFVLVMQKAN